MNQDLGFYLRQDERGDWLYCEDGEERTATLPERVLWKALAATPAAAPQALPLTWEQIKYEWRGFNEPTDNPVSLSDFEYVARAIERAHGIGANSGGAA